MQTRLRFALAIAPFALAIGCDKEIQDEVPVAEAPAEAPETLEPAEPAAAADPVAPATQPATAPPVAAPVEGAQAAEKARVAPTAADLAAFTAGMGEGTLRATIKTTEGEFDCVLDEEKAPITVANFVGLATGKKAWIDPKTREPVVGRPLYQDVLCHRVIPNFMIQCGDPTGTGMGGPGYQIADEFETTWKHEGAGYLSMANAGPNTGGSQFFVTETAQPRLDNKHTVFGKCENAEPIVKKIARVPTAGANRPVDDVKITSIEITRS